MNTGGQGGGAANPDEAVGGADPDGTLPEAPFSRLWSQPGADATVAVSVEPAGRVLGRRYEVGALLGRGGSGVVFRATDRLLGTEVAIKCLYPLSTEARLRVAREVAAMRLLNLPGVVKLLDYGEENGEHFLVMELVEGTPFPGVGAERRWEVVGPRLVALLEILARIHAQGILHRDLKPANVLVDSDGHVVLLDFGLARGAPLGASVTQIAGIRGTPLYIAPEVYRGLRADARADLYAIGVMAFDALTGRLPHDEEDLQSLSAAVVGRDAPSLGHLLPDLPQGACRLIDRLLCRDRSGRPGAAAEAIHALSHAAPPVAEEAFPRLGRPDAVQALVEGARAGRSVAVWGPRGTGRTRVLRDAVRLLEAEGREVVWALPGRRTAESLRSVLGSGAGATGVEMEATLRAMLSRGVIIAADDADALDYWSTGLLSRLVDTGTVLRVAPDPAAVHLVPLTESELRPLFAGPDRLLHLQEDGARVLFERAGGLPARVTAEVRGWLAAGLARWRDGRVALDRAAIARLEAGVVVELTWSPPPEGLERLDAPLRDLLGWIVLAGPAASVPFLVEATGLVQWEVELQVEELVRRGHASVHASGRIEATAGQAAVPDWSEEQHRAAHHAIARALSPGSPRRLAHLLSAEDLEEAGREALALGERLSREGHPQLAMGPLSLGLAVVRSGSEAVEEEALLLALARAAFATLTPLSVDEALYDLDRCVLLTEPVLAVRHLLRADQARSRGDLSACGRELAAVPEQADPELEAWRWRILLQHRVATPKVGVAEIAREAWQWAGARPERRAVVAGWLGVVRYRQERYEEAVVLHQEAARLALTPDARWSAEVSAAAAQLDGQFLDAAVVAALSLRDTARGARLARLEGRAEWILRSAIYRSGGLEQPDLELVAAAGAVGSPTLHAQVAMVEAAFAWRLGLLAATRELAGIAADRWSSRNFQAGVQLVEALAFAAGGARPPLPTRLEPAGLALQAFALFALASPGEVADLRRLAAPLVRVLACYPPHARMEILSASEVSAALGLPLPRSEPAPPHPLEIRT